MQRIQLHNVTNQQFNILLDGVLYGIRLRTVNRYGVTQTLADIYISGELVKPSVRCMPNTPLIPYDYLTVDGANFFFHCINGDYPFYEHFNVTQTLCYATAQEMAELWQ